MFWRKGIVFSAFLVAVSVERVSAKVRGSFKKEAGSRSQRRLMGMGQGSSMGSHSPPSPHVNNEIHPQGVEADTAMYDLGDADVVASDTDVGGKGKGGGTKSTLQDLLDAGCPKDKQHKACICHGSADHYNLICVAGDSKHTPGASDGGGTMPDYCPGTYVEGRGPLKVKGEIGPGSKCYFEGDDITVTGDPHFSMWKGRRFDFHGGCDLVLVDDPLFNNGQGLTIHIRTKIVRWWSYVESAVVKIGSDTLEVKAGDDERAFWVNGDQGDSALTHHSGPMPFTIGGFKVRYRIPADNQFQFKIFLDEDVQVVMKSVREFLRVDILGGTEDLFGSSVGLMGDFATGSMLARDGQKVIEDPVDFGMEWQVLASEPKLFHDSEGPQHPATCAMPTLLGEMDEMVEKVSRRLVGASITRDMAEDACAHAATVEFDDCVSDVLATDDLALAGAY